MSTINFVAVFDACLWNVSSAPKDHLPWQSSPYNTCFGSRQPGILATWPAHVTWALCRRVPTQGDARPFYDLRVRIFVLPSDVEKSAEAAQVDMIELVGVYVSAVHSPGLTWVEKSDEYHCTVNCFSLVKRLIAIRSQTFSRSVPKATLALAILLLTSASISIWTTLESALPW